MLRKALLITGISLGLLVAIFAPRAMAQTVTQQIQNGLCAGSNLQVNSTTPPANSCDFVSSGSQQFSSILSHVINVLSFLVGAVAVIMIIIGGFRYVTSGGNDTSITSAKNTILYAIIGLVIVALSQILVHFVLNSITG